MYVNIISETCYWYKQIINDKIPEWFGINLEYLRNREIKSDLAQIWIVLLHMKYIN